MKMFWPLPDVQATQALGQQLARNCPWAASAPVVLFLTGELGAGKTTLAAALLHALGVKEAVRSPSYALVELYEIHGARAVHMDLYRLQGVADLEQLGVRDYLEGQVLILIEWPERAPHGLPAPDLVLTLQTIPTRGASAQAQSASGERWLAAIGTD